MVGNVTISKVEDLVYFVHTKQGRKARAIRGIGWYHRMYVDRDSLVGIAICYVLDGLGIEPR